VRLFMPCGFAPLVRELAELAGAAPFSPLSGLETARFAMREVEAWKESTRDAVLSGACAAFASALALAWRGQRDAGDAMAPLNGPSQWIWGRRAPSARGFSVKHTVVGYATHHCAAFFWAVLFERARRRFGRPAATALATAATANVVDYVFTPKRLQPGYERQLRRPSLVWVYGAFAAGLALSVALRPRR
jgi:hypothetical protein